MGFTSNRKILVSTVEESVAFTLCRIIGTDSVIQSVVFPGGRSSAIHSCHPFRP